MEFLHDGILYLGRLFRAALMLAPPAQHRRVRADWMHAGVVAGSLFVLYAASAPRTVAMEDDGLFVLSSYFLGIEHPPGYPLFTLIGHLFTYLPFGSVAYRVHLASAFFGAFSCAALWLAARSLIPGRLPAYVAAYGLGVSPVFWSQAIIAEVYTVNTSFFLLLLNLALRACPSAGSAPTGTERSRLLRWMAFLFGLSLSNHYPLMLLAAPAFAILLWPLRLELLRRAGVLTGLILLGLLPYVWLVRRSWDALPISFYGPLETFPEIWFFLSRAGYANVDHSVSAHWVDQLKFLVFTGEQWFVQFAIAGTLLGGLGFAVQWRAVGRRVGLALTLAFFMPSVVLSLLLGFDYSAVTKHIFHVYPLPSYAVGALWMALGCAWLVGRYRLARSHAIAGGAILISVILAVAARHNFFGDHGWQARYAQAVLDALPPNAVLFTKGDHDLAPIAYYHMIEERRRDITLYQSEGLVLGNRLFHPLRIDSASSQRLVREMIDRQADPVAFTVQPIAGYPLRDRWLYAEIDKAASDPQSVTVDLPERATHFFEEDVLRSEHANAWVAFFQGEQRRRFAALLAQSLPRDQMPDRRTRHQVEILSGNFLGALGIAEGLILNPKGYSVGQVAAVLESVRKLTPADATKDQLARYFYLRGMVRRDQRDVSGAIDDFQTALSIWPTPDNMVIQPLEDLYRKAGDQNALKALHERIGKLKQLMPVRSML